MQIVEISSAQNDFVKYCVKLQNSKFRKDEKVILVDGEKTIEGLISDNVLFKYFICKKDCKFLNKINAEKIVYVTDEILKKITTTKTPTFFAGIIDEPEFDYDNFLKLNKIALIDGIKDAGNLGTIIRSAVAFSIDGIILFNDCVDLYNSKTIRATAQNMFKIPILITKNIEDIIKIKETHTLISTVVDSKNEFSQYKFNDKFIIAFGSEADGISDEILQISDENLTFKMDNNVESLNLGVCASVAFSLIKYLK